MESMVDELSTDVIAELSMVNIMPFVGLFVGEAVFCDVGSFVIGADIVGFDEGFCVGSCDGLYVGYAVGSIVGSAVGLIEGTLVGCTVVGITVGYIVGVYV